jgi:DNA polymerase III alpha subunit
MPRRKKEVREMIQNQQAFIALLNWYIDLAGPDIYLEVQRLAGEGDRRAHDVVMVRENK